MQVIADIKVTYIHLKTIVLDPGFAFEKKRENVGI